MKSILKIIGLSLVILFVVSACQFSDILDKKLVIEPKDKVWVYIEIKITLPRDTTDYFYYGQVDESILKRIETNPGANGLFVLTNIRFWNDDDLLEVLDDENDIGYKVFRISDIQYISVYKRDPVYKYELKELHESAKRIRGNE